MRLNNCRNSILILIMIILIIVAHSSEARACTWIYTTYGWKHFEFPLPPPVKAKVDVVYIFSSASDATLGSPELPTWVLGPSGPWNISLTSIDPYGNPMPYMGIRYSLAPGGVPDTAVEGAWFISSFETPDPFIFGTLTRFHGNSLTNEFLVDTGTGLSPIYANVPPAITGPDAIYQYIINTYLINSIPTLTEWGLIIFGMLLVGFMTWVFLRRRRAATIGI